MKERESRGGPTAAALAVLILSTSIGSATTACRDPLVPERSVSNRPIQIDEDGYVSSRTCKACHPSEYATWHGSYHRTMTQVATSDTVVPSFDGVEIRQVYGRPMRLERREAALWAEFDDPDWSRTGDAPRLKRQVVMITGSHHQQVYWYASGQNRLLGQLPAIYLLREQRWIPRRAAVLHPPTDPLFSETGHWNSTCVACHATHGKPQFDAPFGSRPIDTQHIDTTTSEFGIACEACHGPSEAHARANRRPERRYWFHLTGRSDSTTVQPARLNARLSSQVCGQCHGVWEFYDQQGERQANTLGLPYRPGDELAKTRFVAQPTRNQEAPTMRALLADDRGFIKDSFWSDGMVRVTGREYNGLIESPCFKNATDDRRTLSCFSCHTMHKPAGDPRPIREWADDQLTPGMDGNGACLQCHPSFRADLTAHTKHRADSAGSSCYNCHMPYTSYGLLKTIRSHQISSPSVAATVATGRPNACNLCHLDKSLGWTADSLEQWYRTPKPALADDERSIAASIIALLRGDAGQRAIAAAAMGWVPAQQASGTNWMPFFLAQSLDDPYDAVRFVASRSLRGLPGFSALQYDFVAPSRQRFDAQLRTIDIWRRAWRSGDRRAGASLLFDADGTPRGEVVTRLLRERDHRRVLLRE